MDRHPNFIICPILMEFFSFDSLSKFLPEFFNEIGLSSYHFQNKQSQRGRKWTDTHIVQNVLMCPSHDCIQQIIVLSTMLRPHLLKYTLAQLSLVNMLRSYHASPGVAPQVNLVIYCTGSDLLHSHIRSIAQTPVCIMNQVIKQLVNGLWCNRPRYLSFNTGMIKRFIVFDRWHLAIKRLIIPSILVYCIQYH